VTVHVPATGDVQHITHLTLTHVSVCAIVHAQETTSCIPTLVDVSATVTALKVTNLIATDVSALEITIVAVMHITLAINTDASNMVDPSVQSDTFKDTVIGFARCFSPERTDRYRVHTYVHYCITIHNVRVVCKHSVYCLLP